MAKSNCEIMRVLINTPNWKHPELGGVSSHFYGLQPYWTENVRYNIVGSRNKPGRGWFWLPWDILKTIWKILFFRPDVLMVNTSLARNALRRDSLFINIAHALGVHPVVHFHGFNVNYAKCIDVQKFLSFFRYAESFIVLSKAIKEQLEVWGVKCPIYLSTTKVDEKLISDISLERRRGQIKTILYLGRVEREKGIFLSLDIYSLLQCKYPQLNYVVVGGGTDLNNAKQYAHEKGIKNIDFTGPLTGKALKQQFVNADLYLFTSFHEGMPTSVLEAMCFGLPIITRPVGGLVDFFENGKMGKMIDSFVPEDFIEPIDNFICHPELVQTISYYNHRYGTSHFLASQVANHLEMILREIC